MKINSITIGFIEIPGQISLNIYAQGCKKNCKGCHNKKLQDFNGGIDYSISDMEEVLNKFTLPSAVCFLGGDAVYQPEELIKFSKFFKDKKYIVCLYTGKYFEELEENIKENLDMIIDGPWEKDKGTIDKPTTNQRCFVKEKIKNKNIFKWKQIYFKEVKLHFSKYLR